jgi:hypothetical protein
VLSGAERGLLITLFFLSFGYIYCFISLADAVAAGFGDQGIHRASARQSAGGGQWSGQFRR